MCWRLANNINNSGIGLGGVICISNSSLNVNKSTTIQDDDSKLKKSFAKSHVLITLGEKEQIDLNCMNRLSDLGLLESNSVFTVPGKRSPSMPLSKIEMTEIMTFLSKRMYLRNLGLEAMADRVENLWKV